MSASAAGVTLPGAAVRYPRLPGLGYLRGGSAGFGAAHPQGKRNNGPVAVMSSIADIGVSATVHLAPSARVLGSEG
jgi:hypothetical protein